MKYVMFNLVVGAALVWLVLSDRPITDTSTSPGPQPSKARATVPSSVPPTVSAMPTLVDPRPAQAPKPVTEVALQAPPLPDKASSQVAGHSLIPTRTSAPEPQAFAASTLERSVDPVPSVSPRERANQLRTLASDMETLFLETLE